MWSHASDHSLLLRDLHAAHVVILVFISVVAISLVVFRLINIIGLQRIFIQNIIQLIIIYVLITAECLFSTADLLLALVSIIYTLLILVLGLDDVVILCIYMIIISAPRSLAMMKRCLSTLAMSST